MKDALDEEVWKNEAKESEDVQSDEEDEELASKAEQAHDEL